MIIHINKCIISVLLHVIVPQLLCEIIDEQSISYGKLLSSRCTLLSYNLKPHFFKIKFDEKLSKITI